MIFVTQMQGEAGGLERWEHSFLMNFKIQLEILKFKASYFEEWYQ